LVKYLHHYRAPAILVHPSGATGIKGTATTTGYNWSVVPIQVVNAADGWPAAE